MDGMDDETLDTVWNGEGYPMETCEHCGRIRHSVPETEGRTAHASAAYAYVVHDSYGCETGCCGHRYVLADVNGNSVSSTFDFGHPYGASEMESFKHDIEDWAKSEGVHVHWEECRISDD